jgi:hypothetical protein
MKMTAFWDIAPCSLIVVDWHIRVVYCLHHQGLDDGGVHTSEMSVYYNETTQCNIPEGYHFHTRCCENLKFHTVILMLGVKYYYPFTCGKL